MKKILVVLDPGHFPKCNKGTAPGYYEGDKMYDLSEYEKEALEAYGIDVIITRKRANDMNLYARGQVAVKNSKGYDAVIFESNHSNGANGKAYGVVAFRSLYLPGSAELGQKLVDAVVGVMKPVTGVTYSRGCQTRKGSSGADYYGVIRGSVSGALNNAQAAKTGVTHSYIMEHGFHDHAVECAFLNNNANLKKIAYAKAKVIADYFGLTKSSNKPSKETSDVIYRVRKSANDVKSQIGAYKNLAAAKDLADKNPGYSVFADTGKLVYTPAKSETFRVLVDISNLHIRKGASHKRYASVGYCPKGIYTIVETKSADGFTWGKLKSGAGWIALEYVERL